MRLGVIGTSRYEIAGDTAGWEVHSFSISRDRLSFFDLFDSAFSTPARYVEEIFCRLGAMEGPASAAAGKFVFNPLFEAGALVIMQVVEALRAATPYDGITVVTDHNGVPAGYLFPAHIEVRNPGALSLLSTVDASIDAALCGLLFDCQVRCIAISRLVLSTPEMVYSNGFAYRPNRPIYRWTAERAVALLQATPPAQRAALPVTAIMPHHAGDVLFFALACNGTPPRFSRIAVNRAYRDIIDDNAPQLSVVSIDETIINRSGEFQQDKATPENIYFESFKEGLPRDSLYYYCRPSRDYNATSFNLIDHYAFAMGARCYSNDALLTRRTRAMPRCPAVESAAAFSRVLLHFDAGWPLKIYPRAFQERLIGLLRDRGCVVTVIASDPASYAGLGCEAVAFTGYSPLKALLERHDLLVGMDSFPAHYAAHVMGLPTVCLFASTRPQNSDAPSALHYAALEVGLGCRPCYGVARCPLYGTQQCRNFVGPDEVFSTIVKLLAAATASDGLDPGFPPLDADAWQEDARQGRQGRVRRISTSFLGARIFLHRAIFRRFNNIVLLLREFASVARKDGLLQAGLRTMHFFTKVIRRWRKATEARRSGQTG